MVIGATLWSEGQELCWPIPYVLLYTLQNIDNI